MTGYVSTRYYRAPEIMLTWQKYDVAVDIWSTGCIFAEMLEGKPLFPGKDHVNQFSIITELLGTPPDDVIKTIASENTLRFVQSLPKRERVPFSKKFTNADPLALDLLEKMLVFDPRARITATDALAHEYLAPYHDPTDEPVAAEVFDWSFNDADLPVDTWKVMMYSEILGEFKRSNPRRETRRANVLASGQTSTTLATFRRKVQRDRSLETQPRWTAAHRTRRLQRDSRHEWPAFERWKAVRGLRPAHAAELSGTRMFLCPSKGPPGQVSRAEANEHHSYTTIVVRPRGCCPRVERSLRGKIAHPMVRPRLPPAIFRFFFHPLVIEACVREKEIMINQGGFLVFK